MINCYFQFCFENSICILSAVFPSFQLGALLLTWLRYLHKCVLHPSSIAALCEEEEGGGMKLILQRFTEMCLCVPNSPALEADGDFKKHLHRSLKFLQVWPGGPWELAHVFGRDSSGEAWWGEPLWAWAPCGGPHSFFSSARQYPGLTYQFQINAWLLWLACTHTSAGKYDDNNLMLHVQALFLAVRLTLVHLLCSEGGALEWRSQCLGQLLLFFLVKLLSLRCGYDCLIIQV